MDVKENNLCPYLLRNRGTGHILKPANNMLLCDNFSCEYRHNIGKFFYEGEGPKIGICESGGLIEKVEQIVEQEKADISIPA